MSPIKVLIADDQALVRSGIDAMLALEPDIEVVGECANGLEAVDAVAQYNPDMLFLDIQMPQMDAFGVIEALEGSLHEELFDVDRSSAGKHLTMAGILNNLDKADSSEALAYLANLKPKDAEAIRKMLFKFEDLMRLSAKALTVIMDGVPVERTVIALQGADSELQTKVLSALSPRARRMAEAEMQSPANVAARDIIDTRRSIVDSVLKLVAEGAIELPSEAATAL